MMNSVYRMFGLDKPPKYATISTSRGCINNCGYCSAPLMWNRRWTQRNAVNIVDEMEMLNREYGVDFILFTDDIFTVNQKRTISISEEILRRNLKLLWAFETAVNLVSMELLTLAKKAGCCCVLYGVESGSTTVLTNISKNIKEYDVGNAFRMTKDAGIVSVAFLIIGSPGENEKSINATINLLRQIKPDIILPQIAMITPKTRFFDIAKEKGLIDESLWLTDLPFSYYMVEHDLRTLLRWYKKVYYYMHNDFSIFLRTIKDAVNLYRQVK